MVLHSSLIGIALSFAGAAVLVLLATWSVLAAGWTVLSVLLVLGGVAAAAVTLLDMPISSVFDGSGVTRRALLRHHRLDWMEIDRLSRQRTGILRSSKAAPTGGLLAVKRRRNFHLVDRMEGHVEFLRLRVALGDQGERLGVDRIAKPPLEQTPTWLHRRSRWHPETVPGAVPDSRADR